MKKLLIIASMLILSACSSTADWDYDQSANFNNYNTFAWVADASLTTDTQHYQINPLMEKRVRTAVNQDLTAKGFKMVPLSQADVLINYHATVDKKLDVERFSTRYGANWSHWGRGWGMNVQTDNIVREYEVGTLIIDIIDKASNQLIWRGAKAGKLKSKQTTDKKITAINNTVHTIMRNYPPQVQP